MKRVCLLFISLISTILTIIATTIFAENKIWWALGATLVCLILSITSVVVSISDLFDERCEIDG